MMNDHWLSSDDPVALLDELEYHARLYPTQESFQPSDRKLKLFASACCLAWGSPSAIVEEAAEWKDARAWATSWAACIEQTVGACVPQAMKANFLRDIIGDPYDDLPDLRGCLAPEVLSTARACYDERNADGTLDPARLAVLSDALEEAGCDDTRLLRHLRGEDRPKCPACRGRGTRKNVARPFHYSRANRQPMTDVLEGCERCQGTGGTDGAVVHVRGCWALDCVLGLR